MNSYQNWIQEEKKWIGKYQKKIIIMSVLKVIPATLIGLSVFFGAVTYLQDGDAGIGIMGGFAMGIMVSAVYLLILILALRPGRYVRKIQSAVKQLQMDEEEREQLAREMLETDVSQWRCVSYEMVGHGSNHTPARFRITPHYAFLEGSSPYAILVRLSDIAEVHPEEEKKMRTQYGTQTRMHEFFTLYTIGFYETTKNNGKQLPEYAMGFFDQKIRDQIYVLLIKQMEENSNS